MINRTNWAGQPIHLVTNSPWPIITALALFSFTLSSTLYLHGYASGLTLFTFSLLGVIGTMTLWFRDVDAEGSLLGNHTIPVQKGLMLGFIMFLVSEIIVFFSVFWAYFHSALSPAVEIGSTWPPVGIEALDYIEIPLLNTLLLLSSGASVTYAHHCFIGGQRAHALLGIAITIVLAAIFTAFQGYEYVIAPFTIADSVYGSVFYGGTGLHGLHVILGTIMLVVATARRYNYHRTTHAHVGYESAILYYHIVDVVWLMLYAVFYWWGS